MNNMLKIATNMSRRREIEAPSNARIVFGPSTEISNNIPANRLEQKEGVRRETSSSFSFDLLSMSPATICVALLAGKYSINIANHALYFLTFD